MARNPDLESVLERLVEIRDDPRAPGASEELREVLAGPLSHAVARAAEIAGNAQLYDLEPDLVGAFERLLDDPVKRDPACRGKTAVVDALQRLDASQGDLFLRAARTVQLEPVYGGVQDMAAELRGAAGRGLVRMSHPETLAVLAELLADPELTTRMAAVRAVASHGGQAGLPLLRLRALAGDEAEVVGDCLLGLLQASGAEAIPFVTRFLEGELAETALYALGESRVPEALPLLQQFWRDSVRREPARSALLAVAMMRSDEAIAWLLARVAEEPGPTARDAVAAFEIHRNDARLVERLRQAVEARGDVDLSSAFDAAVG
jgi:hypothetical protein